MKKLIYTASHGVGKLVEESLFNGASEGTGVVNILIWGRNVIGYNLPPEIIDYFIRTQNNLFGSYPNSDDKTPSIVFAVLFAVIFIIHIIIFIINTSRGHYFYLSLVWIFYSAMKIIGFGLRAQWSNDITQITLGLTSEIFLIVPAIIIVSANLILTQRLFTWRHPVGGSRLLFWNFMISIYGLVLILLAITIVASVVPYMYNISYSSYRNWIHTVQFTAVLIIAYSLTSVALIGLSFWLPTKKDELRYTYQPWWIESFAPLYFVEKNAAQKAERGFMKRNSNHRHATRVIAATHHHFHSVKGLTNQRGTLKHNVSMGILIVTTILILVGAIGRAIVVFQARQHRFASPAESKWFMYVVWGVFEVIIMIFYIVGRVDLRFYRPDRLPLEVRRIITAEQTYYPSSDEDEEGFHRDKPETYEKMRRDEIAHGYKNSESRMEPAHLYGREPDYEMGDEKESQFDDDEFDDVDSNDWDFTVPKNEKESSGSEEFNGGDYAHKYDNKAYNHEGQESINHQSYDDGRYNNHDQHAHAPYPTNNDVRETDADSEFHF
ncbi:hypothetical protein CANMA_005172 [Candida margitis]|uniref:uncharacterized protein n=1 Tax=Candida margitis TaxID=1775924 RepID=UPI002225FFEF|nr:uncharacterized protein CANMA_005172 [Candida margitis]KAI5950512.1 hypothetical protein CANMA_005172 [Candida margitis]